MDGIILYNPEGEPELLNNFTYCMHAGDIGIPLAPGPPPNSCNRSYISFELPPILENYYLDSVNVRLYQFESICNGSDQGGNAFPEWNVAGGDTIKCIMSHIDYGFQLDFEDWEKGDVGNPFTFTHNIGTVTDSGIDGYRYLNITDNVLLDYDLGRILTQFRIAFEINTDGDSLRDEVSFTTFESDIEIYQPKLYFYFSDGSAVEDKLLQKLGFSIFITPNPVSESSKISFLTLTPSLSIINLYNIKGQFVRSIFEGNIEKGLKEVFFCKEELSNGIYFVKIQIGSKQVMKKIVVIH